MCRSSCPRERIGGELTSDARKDGRMPLGTKVERAVGVAGDGM